MKREAGFTLIELMIVIAIIAIIAAIAIPGLIAAQRAANERSASASLKTVLVAEADFRANDRDGNRMADFWVGDVYCFFALCPSADGIAPPTPSAASMIKLVEPALAGADANSVLVAGAVPIANSIGLLSPKGSYLYRVFDADSQGSLGVATSLGYANCYNFGRYAFMAFPTTYAAGRQVFIVNEESTIWRADPGPGYVATDTSSVWTWSGTIAGAAWTDATPYPQTPGAVGFAKLD